MDIDTTIIVKHIKAYLDEDIQMRRLKDQEVLVLILEHKLVDEWILLQALQLLLKLLHVEMATPIAQDF